MTAYHAGELEVQRRMGQTEIAVRVGRMIRTEIPAAAAAFLAEQPMVVLAATDDEGRVWASLVTGHAGFVHADTDHTIAVDALPVPGDPLHDVVRRPDQQVGMIAIEPQTRRRMRVNGVAQPTDDGLRIHPDQVYSNCPKYISRRHIDGVAEETHRPAGRHADVLDERLQQIVTRSDTFFIGSADPDGNADASHRGGNPGFLQVLSPNRLRWPDYRGNSMFMTLGNISANPRCGLLIPDWQTGTTLQLTGTAEIIWDEGPQCSVEFTVAEVIELTDVSPLRWGQAELSPANPAR
ncbi:pyridoxamine 5'-phosphate oxidase family protein [Mycolicibacterium mucogenicum]|uniref:Pyridoxamine 5'-phosphate oxidase family protein n=1 Tax=Mycolicibacterium mucogenicum DSM 44124 TaxID=1226753 RepID=A0A8H2JFD6_MYCMU|nr:pyridoxamine 5'-phosphate oxidase family protein [Mycolicibacterium mucogenicum]KAB7757273.1 pyridoxamine 5-phosphate oxidase [Mycolicibacterium mucogenicum DSM 44124]QPG67168.1 pyridoxamine 5'-phosphate oxidase family protein [Mycolicibacterium mucogenicum DSM 44124]